MLFFTIIFNGMDRNGNATYKITGFRPSASSNEYETITKDELKRVVNGRWNEKTQSVTTNQYLHSIIKQIKDLNYCYCVVDR